MNGRVIDVAVVGAGPNGLAAAILLAQRGYSVRVVEAADQAGGGCRTAELTLPGFHHDVCATVVPLALVSPCFRQLFEAGSGPEFVHPSAPLAHPLDGADAVILERSVEETAAGTGVDAARYRRVFAPLAGNLDAVLGQFLGPLRPPRHPVTTSVFGIAALLPALSLARLAFAGERARALFTGLAGHAIMPLDRPASASVGLVLGGVGHAAGWPVIRGGSANLTAALRARLEALGGVVETGHRVELLAELHDARVVIFDTVARDVARICGDALPAGYRRRLARFRQGPGVFKVDWALDGPIPWRDPACARAGTLHLGGTMEEIAAGEAAVYAGRHPERPYVIAAQQTMFDASRAPAGGHTAWAYCHVPNGSRTSMTAAIEAQVERFAPGFRDRIIGRHVMDTAALQAHNPNDVGGDINGGAFTPWQLFARPAPRWSPHTTPNPRIYICSASTPPGGGVHGMGGWWAARAAARRLAR